MVDIESARQALQALELPERDDPVIFGILRRLGLKSVLAELDEASAVAEPFTTDSNQAAVVQSNVVSFSEDVPAEVRDAVSNWQLMAQLAASKAVPDPNDVGSWMDQYVKVLETTGWAWADGERGFAEEDAYGSTVSQKIMAVVSAVLAPTFPAAAAIVLLTLKSLDEMDAKSPWIRLFDRRSQDAHSAGFSFNHCEFEAFGKTSLRGIDFLADAHESFTQILFFRFTRRDATLAHRQRVLTISSQMIAALGPVVREKVMEQVMGNVLAVDIGNQASVMSGGGPAARQDAATGRREP